jgi:hypothetical protein
MPPDRHHRSVILKEKSLPNQWKWEAPPFELSRVLTWAAYDIIATKTGPHAVSRILPIA